MNYVVGIKKYIEFNLIELKSESVDWDIPTRQWDIYYYATTRNIIRNKVTEFGIAKYDSNKTKIK
jgi:hypothetical protein